MKKPRILLFDLEFNGLNANFGWIYCMSYKWYGEKKIWTMSLRDFKSFKEDPTDDRLLCIAASGVVSSADVLVGHYSTRCDLPYLQTRLAEHSLPPAASVPHVDTWRIARDKLRLNSNRLDSLASLLKSPVKKTHLDATVWRKAAAGHVPSLKYIEDHCEKDIKVLEWCYERLRPLMTSHPHLALREAAGCPKCGHGPMQSRGWNLKKAGRTRRMQCQSCGGWSEQPESGGRIR